MEKILATMWADVLAVPGDIDLAAAASKIDRTCWRKHRDEYVEWMRKQSVSYQRERLTALNRAHRSMARARLHRRPFLTVAERLEAGDDATTVLANWTHHIGDGIQRRMMDMTGSDHESAAEFYEARQRHGALHAAFHRHMAKELPADTAACEVMSAEKVRDLYVRITGEPVLVPLAQVA